MQIRIHFSLLRKLSQHKIHQFFRCKPFLGKWHESVNCVKNWWRQVEMEEDCLIKWNRETSFGQIKASVAIGSNFILRGQVAKPSEIMSSPLISNTINILSKIWQHKITIIPKISFDLNVNATYLVGAGIFSINFDDRQWVSKYNLFECLQLYLCSP